MSSAYRGRGRLSPGGITAQLITSLAPLLARGSADACGESTPRCSRALGHRGAAGHGRSRDVPMTTEAFEPSPVRSMLHVVSDGEQALRFLRRTGEFTGASVSGIAFGDPVVATFLEFLLQ